MADVLQTGAEWLAGVAAEHNSRTVTFTNGNGSVAGVPASVGVTKFRYQDNGRSRIVYSDRDYLIEAALLLINGSVAIPVVGDQFLDSEDGFTYGAFDFAGEPCCRPSDPYGVRWRIHCKRSA